MFDVVCRNQSSMGELIINKLMNRVITEAIKSVILTFEFGTKSSREKGVTIENSKSIRIKESDV